MNTWFLVIRLIASIHPEASALIAGSGLWDMSTKTKPKKLMIPVSFVLEQISVEDIECSCHISFLAGLNDGPLKAYISSLSRSDEVEQEADIRRCNFCFEAIIGSQSASHSCGGKAAILENLKKALTPKTGTQLALEILKDKVEQGGQSVIPITQRRQAHRGNSWKAKDFTRLCVAQ